MTTQWSHDEPPRLRVLEDEGPQQRGHEGHHLGPRPLPLRVQPLCAQPPALQTRRPLPGDNNNAIVAFL